MGYKTGIAFFLAVFFTAYFCAARSASDSLTRLATDKFNSGDYAAALNLNIELLKIAQKEQNHHDEAFALHLVGRMHYYLKDIRQALQYNFQANDVAVKYGVDSVIAKTLHFIGTLYQEKGETDSSLYYYRKAQKELEGTGNWAELSTLYGVMGELYLRQLGNDAEGKRCFDLCELYAIKSGNKGKLAFSYIKKCIYACLHNDCKQGEIFAGNARDLYRELKEVEGELYAMNVIFYSKTHCSDSSIYSLVSEMRNIRDSIFGSQTADKIAKYKTLYETEKTNAENKELLIATRSKNILLISTITISLLLLLVLWFAYNRYRIKKERESEKEKSVYKSMQYKAVLEAEEKERSRIAGELHDSIGQILSTAKMIISVVKPADAEDEEVLTNSMSLIDRAVKEVRTISHNLMPSSLTGFGLKAAIKELARNVNASGSLKFTLELSEQLEVTKDEEVVIYRIIQEAVHNIIKHAQATAILLTFENADGDYLLQIKDNGKGFDTTAIKTSTGIGWKNIFLRVELLNGTIDVTSAPGMGTSIRIAFKS